MRAAPLPGLTVRLMGERGERTFVAEASCHARQPSSTTWGAWLAMYSPAVYQAMDSGRVLIADLEGVAVGFAIASPDGLFMLYVKKAYRGNGIGLDLLVAMYGVTRHFVTTADQLTPSWRLWCRRVGITYAIADTPARTGG